MCFHRPFKCPFSIIAFDDCFWEGPLTAIKHHIENEHNMPYPNIIGCAKHYGEIPCDETSNDIKYKKAILTMGQIFFMVCILVNNYMYFHVFHVGLRKNSRGYKYKLKVKYQDRTGGICICTTTDYYSNEVPHILVSNDAIVLPPNFWKKCLDANNIFSFKVHIFKDVT